MYNNWLQKLTESYTQAKRELTESEMILEELNETKEYVNILEHVLNTLLEHEVINEEMIMEALSPSERYDQARRMGLGDKEALRRQSSRWDRLNKIKKLANNDPGVGDMLGSQKWAQAIEIARSSDDDSPARLRRVPEGSPEESDIIHRGLMDVGIYSTHPSHAQAVRDATRTIRANRKYGRQHRADLKRAVRANKQGN